MSTKKKMSTVALKENGNRKFCPIRGHLVISGTIGEGEETLLAFSSRGQSHS